MTADRKVLFGVTASMTAKAFLKGQLSALSRAGNEVHLVVGDSDLGDFPRSEGIHDHYAPVPRDPNPVADLLALTRLIRLCRSIRPSAVVMGTPKMGLLGIIAAWLTRVDVRIYVLHGLRAEGATGLGRQVLLTLERLTMALATEVISVSPSLRTAALRESLCSPDRIRVLGSGSPNGIDTSRFRPADKAERASARESLGIPEGGLVVAQVGRVCRDKGLGLLPDVATRLVENQPNVHLLLVGSSEVTDPESGGHLAALASMPHVSFIDHVDDIERVYAAVDVLVLVTRREGMPTVVLEAGASGVPVVATRATGTVDAVLEGVTGFLVEYSADSVVEGITTLMQNPSRRGEMGAAARERVMSEYNQGAVWAKWAEVLDPRTGIDEVAGSNQ